MEGWTSHWCSRENMAWYHEYSSFTPPSHMHVVDGWWIYTCMKTMFYGTVNSLRGGSHPSPYCKFSPARGRGKRGSPSRGPFPFLCPIRFRSPLLTESQLISFPLATMMFQFAKSLKSEAEPQHTACPASLDTVSRLETHGSQTVSPHGLSPLEASFPLKAQASTI